MTCTPCARAGWAARPLRQAAAAIQAAFPLLKAFATNAGEAPACRYSAVPTWVAAGITRHTVAAPRHTEITRATTAANP